MSDLENFSASPRLRVVQVFPCCARVSCGPCNAILAFMACQLQAGLDVRAMAPIDSQIPAAQSQPIEHLPITEFDIETEDYSEVALAAATGAPTVFHFHGISPWTDKIARRLKQNSIPYVFTSHGQLNFHGPVHGLKKSVYLNFVNWFIRNASGLHLFTRREADWCKYLLPLWPGQVLVQHNLIRLPDASAVNSYARELLGIPPSEFVFAYLGRLDVRCKGLDLLVQAFAQVSRQTSAHLVMIGPDFAGGRQCLEQLAGQLGCERQIHFLGSQVGAAKWSLLKMGDAFILPSRWEAFGIALAEAIGIGLPAIVSAEINIAPELIVHRAALVSPLSSAALAQAMQQLMTDSHLRQSLAVAGRRWVAETCSFETAGPRFEEFYRLVRHRG